MARRRIEWRVSSAAVVGEIVDARTVALTEDDWRAFESALSTAGFWTMPSLSHGRDVVDGDGAIWIVEGGSKRWLPQW